MTSKRADAVLAVGAQQRVLVVGLAAADVALGSRSMRGSNRAFGHRQAQVAPVLQASLVDVVDPVLEVGLDE